MCTRERKKERKEGKEKGRKEGKKKGAKEERKEGRTDQVIRLASTVMGIKART